MAHVKLPDGVPGIFGPLTADPKAITEGDYGFSPLGAFAQKVAEHAFKVNDEHIQELHRVHYSDDQIFGSSCLCGIGSRSMPT